MSAETGSVQASGAVPLAYAQPSAITAVENRPLPTRVFRHTFKDPIGFLAVVIGCLAIGVLSAMNGARKPPPREQRWVVEGTLVAAALLAGLAAARTLSRFRYAFVVSAKVIRIAPSRRRGNAIINAEYSIDAASIAAIFELPMLEANCLAPGEYLDVIVISQRPRRPIYDLALARRLHRYGDPQPSTANERLRHDPELRGKRARQMALAGIILIAVGIWQGFVLAELDQHGGRTTVWTPVAVLYHLVGTGGTVAIFLIGGISLLLYGVFPGSRE